MNKNDCEFPSISDFQAAFGCEGSINEDMVQCCDFIDRNGNKLRLTFGGIDCYFGCSVFYGDWEVVRIYDETLVRAKINKEKQAVEVFLSSSPEQVCSIKNWPEISVSMVRLK
ncbi:hypothetical protein [Thalassospira sp. TSL5-1]|uniref:hypothetical protein n=1 Tax=Thalassospira sp. TSL5-1 TaxID=1544451 RepID=UPI0011613E0A|nr:hypothetical protein [Thalassospira sp. TSL5-1]